MQCRTLQYCELDTELHGTKAALLRCHSLEFVKHPSVCALHTIFLEVSHDGLKITTNGELNHVSMCHITG